MSDLIDRAEAIMALRLEYPMMPFFKESREEWAIKTEGYRKAEEVIMKLPSVDAPTTMAGVTDAIREAEYRGYMKAVEERPKGEWIPCSERFPEEEGIYLVTARDYIFDITDIVVGTCYFNPNYKFIGTKEILAWQPLPKPWKGADDEVLWQL